jgi:hypothetical protein
VGITQKVENHFVESSKKKWLTTSAKVSLGWLRLGLVYKKPINIEFMSFDHSCTVVGNPGGT